MRLEIRLKGMLADIYMLFQKEFASENRVTPLPLAGALCSSTEQRRLVEDRL